MTSVFPVYREAINKRGSGVLDPRQVWAAAQRCPNRNPAPIRRGDGRTPEKRGKSVCAQSTSQNIRKAHESSGVFAFSGRDRNPCGWVMKQAALTRQSGRNSAFCACTPSRMTASHDDGSSGTQSCSICVGSSRSAASQSPMRSRMYCAAASAQAVSCASNGRRCKSGRSASMRRAASSGSRKSSMQPPQATSIERPGRA